MDKVILFPEAINEEIRALKEYSENPIVPIEKNELDFYFKIRQEFYKKISNIEYPLKTLYESGKKMIQTKTSKISIRDLAKIEREYLNEINSFDEKTKENLNIIHFINLRQSIAKLMYNLYDEKDYELYLLFHPGQMQSIALELSKQLEESLNKDNKSKKQTESKSLLEPNNNQTKKERICNCEIL